MKTRSLATLFALLGAAAVAQARPNTYTSNGSGAWDDPAKWTGNEPNGYPQAGDTATIQNGHTIDITATSATNVEEVSFLTISSGGILQIEGTSEYRAALEFPSIEDQPTLSVDGTDALQIKAYGEVKVFQSMDFDNGGSGNIRGYAVTGKIVVAGPGVVLTLDVPVHGGLTFDGTGSNTEQLHNNSLVRAMNSLTIVIGAALELVSDGSGACNAPLWRTDTGATLQFDVSAGTVAGTSDDLDYFMNSGSLVISNGVTVVATGRSGNAASGAGTFTAPTCIP